MLTPNQVIKDIVNLRSKGFSFDDAIKKVARQHDLREYDVRIVAEITFPELWYRWNPKLDRKGKKRGDKNA